MGKSVVGHPGLFIDRTFDLVEFYSRLHRSIGGTGPRGVAWELELPDPDLDPEQFRIEYLWSEIASKFNPMGGKAQTERRNLALSLFRESEEACSRINRSLLSGHYRSTVVDSDHYVTLDSVLFTASRKIASLLGRFDWSECDTHMGFGPGASFGIARASAHSWTKFESELDVSPHSVSLALAVLAGRPAWCRSLIDKGGCVVPNPKNRVTTVPKNYKRDRVIAIEPLMGIYLQKGIGGVIRHRLNRVGINLNDQSANRLGALVGSLSGELATIDLKAASDTISIGIVEQLLPPDWYQALEQCRSREGVLDSGESFLYRKFSSMGNGFTFELETLIFWGICSAVLELVDAKDRRLLVYGDDIVCPTVHAQIITRALSLAGFTPNQKKTHVDGPFRESCGKHYLSGFDVTPFYVRREIKCAGDLFLLHNNLVRWSRRGFVVDSTSRNSYGGTLQDVLAWIRSHLPSCSQPTICDGYGDSGFIGSFDEVNPRRLKSARDQRDRRYSYTFDHFALRHWPEKAVTREVQNGGLLPFVLSEANNRPTRESWANRLVRLGFSSRTLERSYYDALWFDQSDGDSPPIGKVVARKRARKTLRVPVGEWNEMGPWT